nr:vacuolar sorting protein 18-like [Nicotiana tomentosiformis]
MTLIRCPTIRKFNNIDFSVIAKKHFAWVLTLKNKYPALEDLFHPRQLLTTLSTASQLLSGLLLAGGMPWLFLALSLPNSDHQISDTFVPGGYTLDWSTQMVPHASAVQSEIISEEPAHLASYSLSKFSKLIVGVKPNLSFFFHVNTQQGEAKKALQVLQKPNVSTELQYKFAPDLIMLDAYETVESWMTTKSLNPRKLIPAMMRYSSEPHAKNETHEVIKYLEYCVHRLQNEDPGVHNLLLSLYAKKEDENALLRFLECKFGKGQPGGPEFFYDPKYALRLCLKEKRMRACVHIYSMMSMHEEAVALALQVDPELAMAEADKVEDDEDLRKKLWLMIAKHVIEQEKGTKRENIRKAIAFLKETDGLLKIEDILPFFPDFALIDDFKEAICSSLEDYNEQIEKLKQEMNDATRGADNIRNDISALAQRYTVIDRDEECGVCRRKILNVGGDYRMTRGYMAVGPMAPFYVFPCGHAFHAQCLIAHVTRCTNQAQVSNRSVFSCSASSHHLNSGCTALSSHLFIYVRAHFYCLICILHY